MPSKIVVGIDPWIDMAMEDWRLVEPSTELIPVKVNLDKNFLFELSFLDNFNSDDFTGFVAWGPEFLNFQRLELVGELKKRGFKLPPLIHPSAQISSSAKIQENVWVQAFVYIGPHSVIEFNCCICIGAIVNSDAIIKKSAWIGQHSKINYGAVIGANTLLGDEVIVKKNVLLGKQVRVDSACLIDKNMGDKTFQLHRSNLYGEIVKI